MKERLSGVVEAARPVVDRIARDEELHDHVKNAYTSAARIYEDLIGDRSTTGIARRVVRDKDIQDELRKAVDELRLAGQRVRPQDRHKRRNTTLLLTGIALGILFNPATGPETRRWVKEKLFGAEEPFEYHSPNES